MNKNITARKVLFRTLDIYVFSILGYSSYSAIKYGIDALEQKQSHHTIVYKTFDGLRNGAFIASTIPFTFPVYGYHYLKKLFQE